MDMVFPDATVCAYSRKTSDTKKKYNKNQDGSL